MSGVATLLGWMILAVVCQCGMLTLLILEIRGARDDALRMWMRTVARRTPITYTVADADEARS